MSDVFSQKIVNHELRLMTAAYESIETDEFTLVYSPMYPNNRAKNVFYPKKLTFFDEYSSSQIKFFQKLSNQFNLLTSVKCLSSNKGSDIKESYWESVEKINPALQSNIEAIEYGCQDTLVQFANDVREIFDINGVEADVFSASLRRVRANMACRFFRYEKNGVRIGVGSIFNCGGHDFILNGGVESQHRQQGVGQHIIAHMNAVSENKLAFRTINPVVEALVESKKLFSKVVETELCEV